MNSAESGESCVDAVAQNKEKCKVKNEYEIRGKTTAIFLKGDGERFETLIDTEDLNRLMGVNTTWYAKWEKNSKSHYAVGFVYPGNGEKKCIKLHRFIMDCPQGLVVDHIYHDTLDNRKKELRIIPRGMNAKNRKVYGINTKSGTRGVTWCKKKNKWIVRIVSDGKSHYQGSYSDLEMAKKVADSVRKRLHVISCSQIIGRNTHVDAAV